MMIDDSGEKTPPALPPGEGERRAQRGYVPQYDLGARLVYEALAAGQLLWVGVAHRGAGKFDDLVLGLRGKIVAHQVKTSRDPEPFSVRTLLLGAPGLLGRMLETRRALKTEHPGVEVETVYACDDYPRTGDHIGGDGSPSSAEFLREHERHGRSWTLDEWQRSPFVELVADLQRSSGLKDQEFAAVWRRTRFVTAGRGHSTGAQPRYLGDARRISDVAALLPRLAADGADKNEWSVDEILSRLRWRDPFVARHGHAFPIDALHQRNIPSEEELQRVLAATSSGYVSLVGPPGSGKSTLLATAVLAAPGATVVRYTAYLPSEGHGLGRAEASDFLRDLVTQLKQSGLGADIMPGADRDELRAQLETLLAEAKARHAADGTRSLVVIDGLDHVPREERPERSFLRELPLPEVVPDGVVFLLGTQRLELDDIPPGVVSQASQGSRCVNVGPLTREAVSRLADVAGVPDDVDREALYRHTSGHPLATRYAIGALLSARSEDARQAWLQEGPLYGGDLDIYYERAWRDVERDPNAQRALAYLALAEGPIAVPTLDRLLGSASTDAAWHAAGHLLAKSSQNGWTVFHNSFRLFLRDRTGLRHGVFDSGAARTRYRELAELARDADQDDPQRWMELRYRARAGDQAAVASLALPERFRQQFAQGRNPADIREDIVFGLVAARGLRNARLLLDLILADHELTMRAEAIGDEVFEAFVDTGDLRAALGLVKASGTALSAGKGYELVDAFLRAGDDAAARSLFYDLEPVAKLLGSEPVDRTADQDELFGWARVALVFRDAGQVLELLGRLRGPEGQQVIGFDLDEYREQLKVEIACGHLDRAPDAEIDSLAQQLQLGSAHRLYLVEQAAYAAWQAGNDALAARHLGELARLAAELSEKTRIGAAYASARIGRMDFAASLLDGVHPPKLPATTDSDAAQQLKSGSRDVVRYAALSAQLGRPLVRGETPSARLVAILQEHLENVGRLLGEGRAGKSPSHEPLSEFRATLDFLDRAEGEDAYDSHRWYIDYAIEEAVAAIVEAAHALGANVFAVLIEHMDSRLNGGSARLTRPPVRRSYALATYRYEMNPQTAEARLAYERGFEQTPAEELAEAGRCASALSRFGLSDGARAVLSEAQGESLGYARRAKKDAQYLLWRDLLARACDEDPSRAPECLSFLSRLLTGLKETIGHEVARRLAPFFLELAARTDLPWTRAARELVERVGLAQWSEQVEAVVLGLTRRRPDLYAAATVVLGRLALPFGGGEGTVLPAIVQGAPEEQVRFIVEHAIACLETDCRPEKRILAIEAIVDAASARSCAPGSDALARWRKELPKPSSGESPEDPFFLVRTAEDFRAVLREVGNGPGSWNAVPAFRRIAPRIDYESARAIFELSEVVSADERAIAALADAALTAGQREEATRLVERLGELAARRAGWGGFIRGDSKQLYHALTVRLNGEPARRAAFDAFCSDLISGHEYVESVFSSVADVLDLLSPRPTWAEAWASLCDQLSHFREYRRGHDVLVQSDPEGEDEDALVDILYDAIDCGSSALADMARVAAGELAETAGGANVVSRLIRRLLSAGGYGATEAAQVAWECRRVEAIRDGVVEILGSMHDSHDLAVRNTAQALGRGWGIILGSKGRSLPAIYSLTLPPDERADRYEPPSGLSGTSPGLYSEDPYAWTWPLEDAATLAARASGLPVANIRARVYQLMRQIGGAGAFGPDASARQLEHLQRLGLQSEFRRLLVTAAFQAMRMALGELVDAGAVPPGATDSILAACGAFPLGARTVAPRVRPAGVPMPRIPDFYGSTTEEDWRASALDDAVRPTMDGHIVLASAAVHQRRSFRDTWVVEQYFGPETDASAGTLYQQVAQLPRVFVGESIEPEYDGDAPHAVAHPRADISGVVRPHGLMFCPRVAADLGWSPSDESFAFVDKDGLLAARTVYWRDGGVQSVPTDRSTFRHGFLVVVPDTHAADVRRYLEDELVARAWRASQHGDADSRISVRASQPTKA
jgi:hypothetical protein